jgi:hypothetical protein
MQVVRCLASLLQGRDKNVSSQNSSSSGGGGRSEINPGKRKSETLTTVGTEAKVGGQHSTSATKFQFQYSDFRSANRRPPNKSPIVQAVASFTMCLAF